MPRVFLAALLAGIALPIGTSAFAVQPDPAYLDSKGGDGCWVHFFDGRDFEGSMGRLAGSLYMNSVLGPGLVGTLATKEYLRRAESLVVGPEARLIAYAEPGFREELVTLEAGRKVADLRELGIPDRTGSLKIACPR